MSASEKKGRGEESWMQVISFHGLGPYNVPCDTCDKAKPRRMRAWCATGWLDGACRALMPEGALSAIPCALKPLVT